MEIQGLSDAQNNHSQHGALCGTTLPIHPTTPCSRTRFISSQSEAGGLREPKSDNNNTRPRTASFRLQAEHSSVVDCSPECKPQPSDKNTFTDNRHLNVNLNKDNVVHVQPDPQESTQTAWSYRDGRVDNERKMALPLFEEEGGQETLSTAAASGLRQHHEGVPLSALASQSVVEPDSPGSKEAEQLYVIFNAAQHNDSTEASTPGSASASADTAPLKSARRECCNHNARPRGSMEVENNNNLILREPSDVLNALKPQEVKKNEHSFSLPNNGFNTKRTDYHHIIEDVFSNKYGDKIYGQACKDTSDCKVLREDLDVSSALVSVRSDLMEAVDSQDFIPDSERLQTGANQPTMSSSSTPAIETFSGTITINNQSIIVTIDNGILTLSTPPEGYVHKEDELIHLKEHLGMKDHEDFVLLNYDGGAKTIGKINTLEVPSSSQLKEISLVEDYALSETSLDSCSILKREVGTVYAVTEADLVSPSPKAAVSNAENEDVHGPIKSKKDIVSSFACPEPGCPCTFDSRQKLKVHLLNHAEDPRPFQCTMEGCGWAFATSYKLKRHIQSHGKQRPHVCQVEGCGRRFTTVYNLKAHVKIHEQDNAFVCDICSERFRSATRLANHQRVHFEPQRPHKCEFPGCEKTFLTFSALFSHNRTHFRETGHFACHFPGCEKTYDKACRLKIHLRSHTGERPFVCDSEGCGWSFTSMSKLLRHKRKHDDDRRFVCTEEGCGKSFTRAEHLKGHSITHLGTKPFQCHAEGCNAKFSARSSLYIHSKKHKQDASSLRNRCPVTNCTKHFSSRSSLKSHMLKCHHISPDVLSQMETTPTLTPSSELVSPSPALVPGAGVGVDQLTNLDLSSLLSGVSGGTMPTAGIGIGIPVGGVASSGMFTMDLSLVSSGILTIDPASVGATLSTGTAATLAKTVDPLLLATGVEVGSHEVLERTVPPPQGTLNLDDVQSVRSLSMQGPGTVVDPLSIESRAPVVELLGSSSKGQEVNGPGPGPLLSCVEVMETQEGDKVLTQFVFSGSNSSFSPQKDSEHTAVSPNNFLETGGSARTDYRAIQLAKKRKQRGPVSGLRRAKILKTAAAPLAPSGAHYCESTPSSTGGLTLRDAGPQYVHIQLLQDDPASDGDLAFQLTSQPSSSHSQLTVDLPVNILQEPSVMTEDDNGSENSQFTGSTINLQDLE